MQAEVVEIIIPGGNDSAVDPKSVSTSEKRSLVFWHLHDHIKVSIHLHDKKMKEDLKHANRRGNSCCSAKTLICKTVIWLMN